MYSSLAEANFPVFVKPDRGYGSRHTLLAATPDEAQAFISKHEKRAMVLLEYLPGKEWTIDCFTDRHGQLRFCSGRGRNRISNGISVNTSPCSEFLTEFDAWAHAINDALKPRGAWFFQMKQDAADEPKLLEVAARLGGSSAVFRCKGVNFALLSAFDAFDHEISIAPNDYAIELDRALHNSYKIDIHFNHVFVDLDDCILIRGRINHQIIGFLYKAVSDGKGLTLLTRHYRNPEDTLNHLRLSGLFDRVFHLEANERKSKYIDRRDAIFIDDSFAERADVATRASIPVFSPDMVESLF